MKVERWNDNSDGILNHYSSVLTLETGVANF